MIGAFAISCIEELKMSEEIENKDKMFKLLYDCLSLVEGSITCHQNACTQNFAPLITKHPNIIATKSLYLYENVNTNPIHTKTF